MKNVLELLEQTAALYPDKTGVEDDRSSYTWSELLLKAASIGAFLASEISPGKPIVILAEKSSLTLSAMFGCTYAGCFYVMVDPSQPVGRMRGIFNVLKPDMVLTVPEKVDILKESGYEGRSIVLNEALGLDEITDNNLTPDAYARIMTIRDAMTADDILYGIFTSGSTGVPKCIAVSHRCVLDFIGHFTKTFGIREDDRIGNQAPFDFDVSVKDIYSCLMTGATLVLIPKPFFSVPSGLLDYLCDKEVTVMIWAVSALSLVAALKGLSYKVPEKARLIMFSGEVMPVKLLRMWQNALPDTRFVNLYGPSEITCNCTYYPIDHVPEDGEKIPIGKAFEGRTVFLLDDQDKVITEENIAGEIISAGESVSLGYYNNPEETAKHFINYPVPGMGEQRVYRTGDLGYYDHDGNIVFTGRKDFQIKHMGHRIELEEIQCAIEQVAGVQRSCALMDERHNILVAFYMGEASVSDVRNYLKENFPIYMVPHKIKQTDVMPLNKNGKTDRNYFKALLEKKNK